jgi:hypothetical protein
VYHAPISGDATVDLNTFTFFYKVRAPARHTVATCCRSVASPRATHYLATCASIVSQHALHACCRHRRAVATRVLSPRAHCRHAQDDDVHDAITILFESEPCLRVCSFESWPDRPRVFDGTRRLWDQTPTRMKP